MSNHRQPAALPASIASGGSPGSIRSKVRKLPGSADDLLQAADAAIAEMTGSKAGTAVTFCAAGTARIRCWEDQAMIVSAAVPATTFSPAEPATT